MRADGGLRWDGEVAADGTDTGGSRMQRADD